MSTSVRPPASLAILLLTCGVVEGCSLTPYLDRQRDAAAQYYPTSITAERQVHRAPRKLRVRVYAVERYRTMKLGWQVDFYQLIERANEVLRDDFGVEFELTELKAWPNVDDFGLLDDGLRALVQLDPGADVDLVVGLVSPLPVVTTAVHQLGRANLLGRHLVLRGFDDSEEYRAFAEVFHLLSEDERERLYRARTRHKALGVFLHELGHALGSIHDIRPESLMNPFYDAKQYRFGPTALAAMDLGLEARLRGEAGRDELRAFYTQARLGGGMESERRAMIALLSRPDRAGVLATERDVSTPEPRAWGAPEEAPRVGDGRTSGARGAPADPASDPEPPPARDPLAVAEAAAARGDAQEAWRILQPLADAAPEDARIQSFACALTIATSTATAVERCAHAEAVGPQSTPARLATASALLAAGARGRARKKLAEVERSLERAGEPSSPEYWVMLGVLQSAAQEVSHAERSVLRAAHDDSRARDVRAWAASMRARFSPPLAMPGAPSPSGPSPGSLSPDDEGEYLDLRAELSEHIARGDLASARRSAAALAARFPGVLGGELDLCEAELRRAEFAAARRHCQAASARAPSLARPHAILGMIAFSSGAPRNAVVHLERAHERAPDDAEITTALAAVLRATHQPARAAALEARTARTSARRAPR